MRRQQGRTDSSMAAELRAGCQPVVLRRPPRLAWKVPEHAASAEQRWLQREVWRSVLWLVPQASEPRLRYRHLRWAVRRADENRVVPAVPVWFLPERRHLLLALVAAPCRLPALAPDSLPSRHRFRQMRASGAMFRLIQPLRLPESRPTAPVRSLRSCRTGRIAKPPRPLSGRIPAGSSRGNAWPAWVAGTRAARCRWLAARRADARLRIFSGHRGSRTWQ